MPKAYLQKQAVFFCSLPFFKLMTMKMTMLFTFSIMFWSSPAHKLGSESFLPQKALNTKAMSQRKVFSPLFIPSAAFLTKRGENLSTFGSTCAVPWQGVPGSLAMETLPWCSLQYFRWSIYKSSWPDKCRSQAIQYWIWGSIISFRYSKCIFDTLVVNL